MTVIKKTVDCAIRIVQKETRFFVGKKEQRRCQKPKEQSM